MTSWLTELSHNGAHSFQHVKCLTHHVPISSNHRNQSYNLQTPPQKYPWLHLTRTLCWLLSQESQERSREERGGRVRGPAGASSDSRREISLLREMERVWTNSGADGPNHSLSCFTQADLSTCGWEKNGIDWERSPPLASRIIHWPSVSKSWAAESSRQLSLEYCLQEIDLWGGFVVTCVLWDKSRMDENETRK